MMERLEDSFAMPCFSSRVCPYAFSFIRKKSLTTKAEAVVVLTKFGTNLVLDNIIIKK